MDNNNFLDEEGNHLCTFADPKEIIKRHIIKIIYDSNNQEGTISTNLGALKNKFPIDPNSPFNDFNLKANSQITKFQEAIATNQQGPTSHLFSRGAMDVFYKLGLQEQLTPKNICSLHKNGITATFTPE